MVKQAEAIDLIGRLFHDLKADEQGSTPRSCRYVAVC